MRGIELVTRGRKLVLDDIAQVGEVTEALS
jgi:hypothetical protein